MENTEVEDKELGQPAGMKCFTNGTHRVCSPHETYARVSGRLSAFGITRVGDVTGLDTVNIPVYMCIRPNAKSLSVSQGKGLDRMHAKVSAIMESIELYHAENVTLPRKRGSYADMRDQQPTLDPHKLALYPNGYFNDALLLEWVTAKDLSTREDILVPYELVHCDFTTAIDRIPPSFVTSSNGLASGNCFMEASSHAICELLERDATGLFFQNGRFTEERVGDYLIDLDSVADPHFRRLHQLVEAAGLALFAWNETNDIGVPVIGCALIDPSGKSRSGVYCGGHGCHLNKEIALSRAVTEAAQSRLTEISGARDDLRRSHYQLAHSDHVRKTSIRCFLSQRPSVRFDDIPSLATDNVARDVEVLIELLDQQGYDRVAVVDLSDAEHGITVVKVIIPGIGDFADGLNVPRSNLRR